MCVKINCKTVHAITASPALGKRSAPVFDRAGMEYARSCQCQLRIELRIHSLRTTCSVAGSAGCTIFCPDGSVRSQSDSFAEILIGDQIDLAGIGSRCFCKQHRLTNRLIICQKMNRTDSQNITLCRIKTQMREKRLVCILATSGPTMT